MVASDLVPVNRKARRRVTHPFADEILDRISDAFYALDRKWRITYANRRLAQIVGKRRDSLIGKDVRDVLSGVIDGDGFLAHARALEQRQPVTYESRPAALGRWIETTVYPDATGVSVHIREIEDRKRVETALRDSEARHRWLVENTTEAVWCVAFEPPVPTDLPVDEQISRIYRDRRLVDCNEGMVRMYGFASIDEMLRLPLNEIMPRAEAANRSYLRAFIRAGYRAIDVESLDATKDGRTIHTVNNLVGVVEDGLLVQAWGTTRDVTARKRSEEALRESQERLEATYEHALIGIVETDLDGRFLRVNARYCAITGYDRDELLGRHFAEFTHPDDLARDQDLFRRQQAGEISAYTVEKRYIHKNGHVVWVELSGTLVRDAAGAPQYGIGTVQDITERKRAEEALRRSEEFNRRILQSSRDCIKVLDLQGRLVSINDQAEAVLRECGISAEGKASYLAFWHGADRAAAEAAISQAVGGGVGRFVGFFRTPAGRPTWWDEVISPILDAAGKPDRLLVVSREITELKMAEDHQQLLMAELNHRVKNTLAVVQSIAFQTLRRAASLEAFADSFNGRLDALSAAQNLLTETNWRSARLESVVRQALKAVGASRRAIALRGPDLPLSPKQTLALSLVLHELATNAAKYGALTAPAGRVRVHWAVEPTQWVRVEWAEAGGPPVQPSPTEGFGTLLIQRTASYDLDGEAELRYDPSGLRCRVHFPRGDMSGDPTAPEC